MPLLLLRASFAACNVAHFTLIHWLPVLVFQQWHTNIHKSAAELAVTLSMLLHLLCHCLEVLWLQLGLLQSGFHAFILPSVSPFIRCAFCFHAGQESV